MTATTYTEDQTVVFGFLLDIEAWLADGVTAGFIEDDAASFHLERWCDNSGTTLEEFRAWASENA